MTPEKTAFKEWQQIKEAKERHKKLLARRKKLVGEIEEAKVKVRRLESDKLAARGGDKFQLATSIAEEIGWLRPGLMPREKTDEERDAWWKLWTTPRDVLEAFAKALGLIPKVEE